MQEKYNKTFIKAKKRRGGRGVVKVQCWKLEKMATSYTRNIKLSSYEKYRKVA